MSERPDAETMVRECLEIEHIFSGRECDFLESIQSRVNSGGSLSPKQDDWLRDLYQKACGSPH